MEEEEEASDGYPSREAQKPPKKEAEGELHGAVVVVVKKWPQRTKKTPSPPTIPLGPCEKTPREVRKGREAKLATRHTMVVVLGRVMVS